MSLIASPFVEWTAASRYQSGAGTAPWRQTPSLYDVPRSSVAGITVTLPIEALPKTFSGAVAASPGTDIFDAIWVVPSEIALGSITEEAVRSVRVWSAYTEPRTLTDVVAYGADGIDVTGVALPYTFAALESVVFEVAVGTDGPAIIDARFELRFDTDEGLPEWTVTGRRILLWSLPPNWRTPYQETYSYKTEVLLAQDGTEQRIALRHRPRRAIDYRTTLAGERARRARRLLATWQNRSYAMPDWVRSVRFGGAAAGDSEVTLDAPLPGLEDGALVVLMGSGFGQALEVDEIDGVQVRFRTPVANDYPIGSRLHLGLVVHAEPVLQGRTASSATEEIALQFREMPSRSDPLRLTAPHTWRGREVFLRRPNWAHTPTAQHAFAFDWLDTGRGLFDFRATHRAAKDLRGFTFLLRSRAEVADLLDFFMRCRGRRGEFYAPTWGQDLVVPDGAVLVAGSLSLPITDGADAERIDEERVYRNIYMRLHDGTEVIRQVVSGSVSDVSGAQLGIDEGWPREIHAREIAVLSWLPRWRLASDDLTVTWRTDQTAEVSLTLQTLEDV